jgi:hypothetical protein
MKYIYSIILGLLLSTNAFAGDLTVCNGKFALCAASTCTETGRTITTNNGVTYPEVACKCPVLEGPSIADLSAGVMKGSCAVDDPTTQVWSLFAPRLVEGFHYPQEANNFVRTPPSKTKAKIQSCPGAIAEGSTNCWGMMCKYDKDPVNGTVTATCSCPIGQIAKGTKFLTEAGQGDKAACAKHPVAAPDPLTKPAKPVKAK